MPGENVAAGVTFQLTCTAVSLRGKEHGDIASFTKRCRCNEKFKDRVHTVENNVRSETATDDALQRVNISLLGEGDTIQH